MSPEPPASALDLRERLQRVVEGGASFAGATSEEALASNALRLLHEVLAIDEASVSVRSRGALRVVARWDPRSREVRKASETVEELLEGCNEIVLKVLSSGAILYVPDTQEDERTSNAGRRGSQLAVPLAVEEGPLGALDVHSGAPDAYGVEDRLVAETLALPLGLALRGLQVRENLMRERERLETLIESSADAIITTDDRGVLTLFSRGAEEIFGYRADEVLGTPVSHYYYRGRREAQRVMERLRVEGKIKNYETWFRSKSGRGVPASLSSSLLYDSSGDIVGTLGILKDITRQKEMEEKLNYTIERLQEANEKLEVLAVTDNLSGLYNHRYFYRELEEEVERAIRTRRPLAVILVDIDRFKEFNDTYGHQVGDRIIEEIGRVVRKCIRRIDTGCRYGGEEFTVILPETKIEQAALVAERIRQSFVRSSVFSELKIHPTTLSVGVATFDPRDGRQAPSEIVRMADRAMYEAKREGGDRVALAEQAPREEPPTDPGAAC